MLRQFIWNYPAGMLCLTTLSVCDVYARRQQEPAVWRCRPHAARARRPALAEARA